MRLLSEARKRLVAGPAGVTLKGLLKNPVSTVGMIIVTSLAVLALLAPHIAPFPGHAFGDVEPSRKLQPPSRECLFGTDELGRDVFSRVLYGARISLGAGAAVLVMALTIGTATGLVAGYMGGWIDELLMRTTDVFLSFPSLLLAMVICTVLRPSLPNTTLAIALAWWPWYARLMRAQAVSVREAGYVKAAKVIGVPTVTILMRHVLMNSLAPVVVQASLDFGSIVLTLASLSFLGLGVQPPTPEWGLMVSQARSLFLTGWWCAVFPGLAIFLTVVGFNLLGDGLREVLDPKTLRARW